MARERPTASSIVPSALTILDGGRSQTEGPLLTRAEARAVRRSARLTHARLKEHLKDLPDRRPQAG